MNRGMRIALISQYFTPEPAKTPASVARRMAMLGHQVRVITGFPNYPNGRIYPGYQQSLNFVEDDEVGVRVHRVPIVPSHSENGVMRAVNYTSFMLSALLRSSLGRGADVTYVYASQPTGALAALVWRKLFKTPYVLHVQDLWPDSITASGMVPAPAAGVVSRVITALLRPVYRHAQAIVAISPTMRNSLIDRGVPAERVHVIYNWSSDESEHPGSAPGDGRVCTVTYAGNLGAAQDLETAVQAARRVADELPRFRLLIVGAGTQAQRLRDAARDLACVEFRDPVPLGDMPSVYKETTFQLVPLKATANLHGAVPSKLQSSLAAGLPVICSAPGAATALVHAAQAGYAVPPSDVDALAETFRRAYACEPAEHARYAQNARSFYLSRLSIDAGIAELERVLSGAAQAR